MDGKVFVAPRKMLKSQICDNRYSCQVNKIRKITSPYVCTIWHIIDCKRYLYIAHLALVSETETEHRHCLAQNSHQACVQSNKFFYDNKFTNQFPFDFLCLKHQCLRRKCFHNDVMLGVGCTGINQCGSSTLTLGVARALVLCRIRNNCLVWSCLIRWIWRKFQNSHEILMQEISQFTRECHTYLNVPKD